MPLAMTAEGVTYYLNFARKSHLQRSKPVGRQ
jgi:hypothetical protein